MKVSVIGYGTRGDVQPAMVLADALRNRGHKVRVLAGTDLAPMLARAGLAHQPLPFDFRAVLTDPKGQAMLARGDIATFLKWLGRIDAAHASEINRAVVDGCADADLIVADTGILDRPFAVATARNIPIVAVSMYPLPPTAVYASPFLTQKNLGPLNRLTHHLVFGIRRRGGREGIDALRKSLGLPRSRRNCVLDIFERRLPHLMCYSQHLAPPPNDWPESVRVIGPIRLPHALRERIGECVLPEGLAAWIQAGDKPIYFGMGSMPVIDPAPMIAILRRVLTETKQRAVVAAGWSDLIADNDEQIRVVGAVNHDWLLPRCRAAVHHGGSGTTHATLSVGLPTTVCSILLDQPFWGHRIEKLGVGATFPFKHFSEALLLRALRRCLEPEVTERAHKLGRLMALEDGLPTAIEWAEHFAARGMATGRSASRSTMVSSTNIQIAKESI